MIKTLVKVPQEDIDRLGRETAFIEFLSMWELLPWVKYLREHGEIINVDSCTSGDFYNDTFTLTWKLTPEQETWFYLNYGEQKNK